MDLLALYLKSWSLLVFLLLSFSWTVESCKRCSPLLAHYIDAQGAYFCTESECLGTVIDFLHRIMADRYSVRLNYKNLK